MRTNKPTRIGDLNMPLDEKSVRVEVAEGSFRGPFDEFLPAGAYEAVLKDVEQVEIPAFKNPEVMEDGVRLLFHLTTPDGGIVEARRDDKLKINKAGNPSNLTKDLMGMVGDEVLRSIFDADDEDRNSVLTKTLNGCIDKNFLIIVGTKTSDSGKQFSKFDSITQGVAKKKAKASKPVENKKDVTFDDDDIPF